MLTNAVYASNKTSFPAYNQVEKHAYWQSPGRRYSAGPKLSPIVCRQHSSAGAADRATAPLPDQRYRYPRELLQHVTTRQAVDASAQKSQRPHHSQAQLCYRTYGRSLLIQISVVTEKDCV